MSAEADLRFERALGLVLRAGVALSSVALTAGLALDVTGRAIGAGNELLSIGLALLIATPVARVVASMTGYLWRRDWLFAGLTAIVLLEIAASAVAAALFNQVL